MDKRRFLPQLPAVHQTETLKKFFGSTVDHTFQPGRAEQISGYIGQRPSYFDATKDFYVPEPTATRRAYQLDPAMASRNANGEVTHLNFYEDLINHPKVMRVVALSGGYERDDANERLSRNKGLIASFSRALLEGLTADQSQEEFDNTLATTIDGIYKASIAG